MKKFLSNPTVTLFVGIAVGLTLARVLDGGNVIGAIVGGVVISSILGAAVYIISQSRD